MCGKTCRRSWIYEQDFLVEKPGGFEQLGVEDGGARRASDRVVAEDRELEVEDGARANATDQRRHPAAMVDVEARLGAVLGGADHDRALGGGGEPERLRQAGEALEQLGDFPGPRRAAAPHRNRRGVALLRGD